MGWTSSYMDYVLSYRTPRYAMVRDWRLGLVHRGLQAACFVYVVGYMILFHGKHLKEIPVSGYTRLDIETPTKDGCSIYDPSCELDLRPLSELPYCLQGKEQILEGQRNCIYLDAFDLATSSPTPNTLFVPFFTNKLRQVKGDTPSQENGFGIARTWLWDGSQQDPTFIADVESFHVLISHSYQAAQDLGSALMGRSQVTDGTLESGEAGAAHLLDQLKDRLPLFSTTQGRRPLGRTRKAGTTASDATVIPEEAGLNDDFPTLARTEWGDRISINDLLKLAEPLGAEVLLSERGEDNLMRRERGGILSISIEYTNFAYFDFWGRAEPHYMISARMLPMQWYYQWYAEFRPEGPQSSAMPDDTHRKIIGHQGLLLVAHIFGNVRRFDSLSFLMAVATAAVLLVVAGTATDWIMAMLMDLARRFEVLRPQPDSNNEFRRLQVAVSAELESRVAPLKEGAPGGTSETSGDDTTRELLALLRRLERRLEDGGCDEGLDDLCTGATEDSMIPGTRLETLGDARSLGLVAPL